jgi:hypothetical protein
MIAANASAETIAITAPRPKGETKRFWVNILSPPRFNRLSSAVTD